MKGSSFVSKKTPQEQSSKAPNIPEYGEDELRRLFTKLQLPRGVVEEKKCPTLRILAVADLSLNSAAALAEYALQNPTLGSVDLIVASGPFVQDSKASQSRQEAAAFAGRMTAILTQLESIVCRVVYCPHAGRDAFTTLVPQDHGQHLRLTPDAVNVHDVWIQLAPGIACCGHGGHVKDDDEKDDCVERLLELSRAESSKDTDMKFSSQVIFVTTRTDCCFDSQQAQDQVVLALSTSDGTPSDHTCGNVRVITPGSLVKRGEFAILHLGLHRKAAKEDEESVLRWSVDCVEFGNMNDDI